MDMSTTSSTLMDLIKKRDSLVASQCDIEQKLEKNADDLQQQQTGSRNTEALKDLIEKRDKLNRELFAVEGRLRRNSDAITTSQADAARSNLDAPASSPISSEATISTEDRLRPADMTSAGSATPPPRWPPIPTIGLSFGRRGGKRTNEAKTMKFPQPLRTSYTSRSFPDEGLSLSWRNSQTGHAFSQTAQRPNSYHNSFMTLRVSLPADRVPGLVDGVWSRRVQNSPFASAHLKGTTD